MDPVSNPFVPGAGSAPRELAGRAVVLETADTAIKRAQVRRHAKGLILTGLRGVGKTVLLNRIDEMAQGAGHRTVYLEAREKSHFAKVLVPGLRSLLLDLSRIESAKEKAQRALGVLKSFLQGLKVNWGDVAVSLPIEPEVGAADSGNLEDDLPCLLLAIGEAAAAAGRAVTLLIDEVQYLDGKEFGALIASMHRVGQLNLPVLLVGAGLPQIPGLAADAKSYAERLFSYPTVGSLNTDDAVSAIVRPAKDLDVVFQTDAVEQILSITERYPYFLQQWAYESWNVASDRCITIGDVEKATPRALAALDEDFFRSRFQRCNNSEKLYLRALADLGSGVQRSAEVAGRLGKSTMAKGPTRDALIKAGMIYSPQHGDICFTVPLFDQYMKRVMPSMER